MAYDEDRAMTTRTRGFAGYSCTWRLVRYLVVLMTKLMGGCCMPKRGCMKQMSGTTCVGDAVNDVVGSGGCSSTGSEASCCSMKAAVRPYAKLREDDRGWEPSRTNEEGPMGWWGPKSGRDGGGGGRSASGWPEGRGRQWVRGM
ncbi:hypothetical protein TRIUR3_31340 [Triticum urartu]|uniref:Uncharacterized protein n=1 Tax=Triticum urartu TaxID=4572 RepID=M7ZKS7_TRIUA|nr:hypothetical protein TRIUR3_31340 [Triticum urartu]